MALTDDWCSIADAKPPYLSNEKSAEWRAGLIHRLSAGLIPAIASRLTRRWIGRRFEPEFSCFGNPAETWDGMRLMELRPPESIEENQQIQTSFWHSDFANDSQEWSEIDFTFTHYSDWNSGDFAMSKCEMKSVYDEEYYHEGWGCMVMPDTDPGEEALRSVTWAIDVHVDRNLLDKFNRRYLVDKPRNRKTKYDWIAAIVHLVGVAELDGLVSDPEEFGALADLEKHIANWFAENSTEQPSEAAIRPYARQVLDAILSRGKRAS